MYTVHISVKYAVAVFVRAFPCPPAVYAPGVILFVIERAQDITRHETASVSAFIISVVPLFVVIIVCRSYRSYGTCAP